MPRHPVHTLLAEAAYAGRELTEEELAELELGASDRELVRKAAREAAFAHRRRRAWARQRTRPAPLARDHRGTPRGAALAAVPLPPT